MKSATISSPISPARTERRTESSPRVASTSCSCSTASCTGSAPELSWITSSRARWRVMPVIVPSRTITPCTTGAESSSSSRKMPSWRPSRRRVICSESTAPSAVHSNCTTGLPTGSVPMKELGSRKRPVSAVGTPSRGAADWIHWPPSPQGAPPRPVSASQNWSSAVRPSSRRASSGSRPGIWIEMPSAPWRVTSASETPAALTRRSSTRTAPSRASSRSPEASSGRLAWSSSLAPPWRSRPSRIVRRSKPPMLTPRPSGQGTPPGSQRPGSEGQTTTSEASVSAAMPSSGSRRVIRAGPARPRRPRRGR